MKTTKLIGAALMASSLLLQVGYAATTTVSHEIVNTGNFDVYFGDPVVTEASELVTVDVKENNNTLEVTVSNIYPGATFNLLTQISNDGTIDAKIKDISLNVKSTTSNSDLEYNTALMDMLVGYDENNNAYNGEKDYGKYLKKAYKNHVIKKGEEIPVEFSIGMNPEITNLQNQVVEFSIDIQLEQVDKVKPPIDPEPEDPTDPEPPIEPEIPVNPEPPVEPDPEIEIPEEVIPGGEILEPEVEIPEVEIPEEPLPGGNTEESEVEIPDEKVPGGGILPQTGGITPTIVYSIGFAMLASGFILYKKEEKEE